MLRVDSVDVYYGDVQALWDITLEVRQGEIVALVGSNGGGKTTTLMAISGVLRAARGAIEFLGEKVDRLPSHRIVEMGLCHVAEGRRLFPHMSVMENLLLGAHNVRARRHLGQSLELVLHMFPVLQERKNQPAGTLSGGEQQMLAIGRGLMAQPRLLMLDEPTLGLAPFMCEQIFDTIAKLRADGLTIVLVEQHVQRALSVADRAYVFQNGRIALSGAGRELLEDRRVKDAYLGTF